MRASVRCILCGDIDPKVGSWYNTIMRIIVFRTLREFWEEHPDSEQQLRAWYQDAKRAEWKTPTEVKDAHRNASIVANNRIIFNIKRNDYRHVVQVRHDLQIIYIRLVGSHMDYDKIDATTI